MYAWNFEPPLVLGLAGLALGYWLAIGPLRQRFADAPPVPAWKIQIFYLAVLILFVALVSPVDTLGGVSLTMHMVQHMLLTLVAAPLLLIGTPNWLLRPLLRVPLVRPILRFLTFPIVALLIYNVVFSLWHVPAAYDAALQNQQLHVAEHLSMLITAIFTWWPIFSPLDELPGPSAPLKCAYLFFQTIPPTILGALITFATGPIYQTYQQGGFFGLTALEDQQLGGLIMWIPGGLVYFLVLTVIFIRWLNRDDPEDEYEQPLASA